MSSKTKTAPPAASATNGKAAKGGAATATATANGAGSGAGKKGASTKTAKTNGTSTDTAAAEDGEVQLTQYSTSSKPDRDTYNKEQENIKAQIAAKQAQLDKVRAKIADSTGAGGGPLGDRRKALRNEQNELRSKTAGHKLERNEVLGQLKQLQEGVSKKIADINKAKSKSSYKSVAEIDGRIKDLERQVESGQMRLVEEKRALSEISDLRRSRKTFDSLGNSQDSIDSDKTKIDELKTKLDNPEYKSLQGRYEEIQKELDEINVEMDKSGQSRDKLFEERNKLQDEVNVLWGRKKESAGAFKEANDKYYTKMNDERQKRIERQQTERRAYEDSKRSEANAAALEEARLPAFGREIEDCTTLINYFSRFQNNGGSAASIPEPTLATVPAATSGGSVPKLELRKADDSIPEGAIMMKKKGEDEDNFFVGKGKKGKGGNNKKTAGGEAEKAKESSQTLNVPFQTVAALLQFNISAPLSRDDVPKTIEALKEKKTWYDANNDKVTKERIAAAEERIRKAEEKSGATTATEGKAAPTAADDEKTADAVEETTEGVGKMDVGEGGADI